MNLSAVRRLRWGRFSRRHSSAGRNRHPRSMAAARGRAAVADDLALQSERARFAAGIDVELRLACRSELAMRRELGDAAVAFLSRRLHRRLGFVRLSDYARERLGVSGLTLQVAAWIATRLDALPAVSRAYDRSELSWAQARVLCRIATVGDEHQWLDVARRCTVEELERLAARAAAPPEVPPDPESSTGEMDGEVAIRWRLVCPARVRALWRRAVELASRMAGEPLATWQAAEIIAAEGSSGQPSGASLGDRALIAVIRAARRHRCAVVAVAAGCDRSGRAPAASGTPAFGGGVRSPARVCAAPFGADRPVAGSVAEAAADVAPSSVLNLSESPAPLRTDAFALDVRLHEAMRAIRSAEPRIGRLLRVVVDHRLYRALGYVRLEEYVRERLGISMRKVWALAKVERAAGRSDEFACAYRDGRLSWVQALTLRPVLDRTNAAAWIARADTVTVRRLGDEVGWVLEARDVSGNAASLAPPPLDARLVWPGAALAAQCRKSSHGEGPGERCRELSPAGDVQIGARFAAGNVGGGGLYPAEHDPPRPEIVDAEIGFVAPASVIALLRDVLDAFAPPAAPRWKALERLLHHVVHHWESTPRHADPIFARDGWRCTVPACSSRRNLHDHHIEFRSRGGLNTRENRTAVCAAHHLHGLHDGTIHAAGTAPFAIEWQLGVRNDAPPLATYVGDRRCDRALVGASLGAL